MPEDECELPPSAFGSSWVGNVCVNIMIMTGFSGGKYIVYYDGL